jgi:cytosine deaminase
MMLDTIFRPVRLASHPNRLVDVGIAKGRIAAIEPVITGEADTVAGKGRLIAPGFIETHIHLDKSCIFDRCVARQGTFDEAIANVAHVGAQADMAACFEMITQRPARLMNLKDYGLSIGDRADLVLLDAVTPEGAVAEPAPVLGAWKGGRLTVTREPALLHRPSDSPAP